jgi:predicted site-specific integrase-resolvase
MLNVCSRRAAAKFLCISGETLDRYRKSGKLPYHKIGDRILFTENDLLTFLDACSIPATVLPTSREKLEMAKANGGKV